MLSRAPRVGKRAPYTGRCEVAADLGLPPKLLSGLLLSLQPAVGLIQEIQRPTGADGPRCTLIRYSLDSDESTEGMAWAKVCALSRWGLDSGTVVPRFSNVIRSGSPFEF